MAKLQQGDRIAYAAKFLKDTGQQAGNGGSRRGTFIAMDPMGPNFCRVTWDDIDAVIASGQGQYGEADYCEHVKKHGSLVNLTAIAKVGSARFACNDIGLKLDAAS